MNSLIVNILAAAENDAAHQIGYLIGTTISVLILLAIPVLFIVSIVKYVKRRSTGWLVVLVITSLPVLAFIGMFSYGIYVGYTSALDKVADDQVEGTDRVVPVAGSPLTIGMPDHWKLLKIVEEDVPLQMGNLFQEEYLMAFSYSKMDILDDLDGFTEYSNDTLLGRMDSGRVVDSRHFEVNGMNVSESEIQGEIDNMRINYLNYVVEGQNDFYQIMTWTLNSKSGSAYPVFREAIQTIEEDHNLNLK
ncbi:hypothetical protein [Cerasicoccus arenae]|uniref:hypothetical protein n=1 Tax=Cerasicoccus arenae TaxID=424488 RepID=UPI00167538AA|nr:hypothetical protein [Cerasicoccus arenae]MBK1858727.1 hypothetical protein [Cerasicoccus arenae]